MSIETGKYVVTNLFMYEENGEEEYSSILISQNKDQLEGLFNLAMSHIKKNHDDLVVVGIVLGEDLDLNAVQSHTRNASFEEKAIFIFNEISPEHKVYPELLEQFKESLKCNDDVEKTVESITAKLV